MLSAWKSGFTLAEALVVVVVLALLAAMAIPAYFKSIETARAAEASGLLSILAAAQQKYSLERESRPYYVDNIDDLDLGTAAGSEVSKYFNLVLVSTATPGIPENERVAYLQRNSFQRPAGRGAYILSVCEDGSSYCTDANPGDCKAINQMRSACP